MASFEQDLIAMVRQLPTPITITWQNGLYHWQCAKGEGASVHLVDALEQALRHIIEHLVNDPNRVDGGDSKGNNSISE